jgi:hypothetical protein
MKNKRHGIKYLVPENDREKPVAARHGWSWLELAGAGWSWLELAGAGWSWLELAGAGWSWPDRLTQLEVAGVGELG